MPLVGSPLNSRLEPHASVLPGNLGDPDDPSNLGNPGAPGNLGNVLPLAALRIQRYRINRNTASNSGGDMGSTEDVKTE